MEYPSLEIEALNLIKDHPEIFKKTDQNTVFILMKAFDNYSRKAANYLFYKSTEIQKAEDEIILSNKTL